MENIGEAALPRVGLPRAGSIPENQAEAQAGVTFPRQSLWA